MARPRPPHQVESILDAGESTLISRGVTGTQMSAVAEAAGVGIGTLYHYFSGKDDLLQWVIIRALRPGIAVPAEVPIGAPPLTVADALRPYLDLARSFPRLHQALATGLEGPIADELVEVVGELCDAVEASDRAQTVIEVISDEMTDVRELWFLDYRRALVEAYAGYLDARADTGALRRFSDPRVTARWLTDTCVLFIRYRRLDHFPDELSSDQLRDRLVDLLVHGLAGAGSDPPDPRSAAPAG